MELFSIPMNPFQETGYNEDQTESIKREIMKQFNLTEEAAEFQIRQSMEGKLYSNDVYTVLVKELAPGSRDNRTAAEIVWLSIKRNDKEPIHDWRDLQAIKNMLVGPECEGVELFPAESRLVDTANQYHLWVFKNPKVGFHFGFNEGRHVDDENTLSNGKQRKFKEEVTVKKNFAIRYWEHLDDGDKWLVSSRWLVGTALVLSVFLTFFCIYWSINPFELFFK